MSKTTRTEKKPIEQYDHKGKERCNNPPVGLVTPETDREGAKKNYAYDPHLDPALVWAGKAEHTSFEIPTVSLHVHERIDPRTIIDAVRKRSGIERQKSLFELTEENPPLRALYEKILKERFGTRMSRIGRIFTDILNPCVSVSFAQSVFYPNKIVKQISAFICVYLRLISLIDISRIINAEVL